jgi:serine protease
MRSLAPTVCVLVLVLLSACSTEPKQDSSSTTPPPPQKSDAVPPPEIQRIEATPDAVAKASDDLEALADRARRMRAALTFDEFKASVYREPFEGGKYIVNGDTPIANDKQLLEFYEENVKPRQRTELVINQAGGLDTKWNQQQKTQLTYCVSTTFGSRHDNVVQQMVSATGAWEQAAAVKYTHVPAQDATCGPSNQNVVFDVRPVNVGEYLARAFFPNEPRSARNVLIDESSFELDPGETLKLVGILRHELGHTLGFRHEHTRPEAGTCFEDNDWRPLTAYDAFSVMHYPQCNGRGDWSLTLTNKDKNASACVYAPAMGFTIDSSLVTGPCATAPAPSTGQPTTQTFTAQSVAKNAENPYPAFSVKPGSQLEVVMNGPGATGDPDLYVRFNMAPTRFKYDCRPYLDGPAETCSLTVPATAKQVFVIVRGYAAGTYDLKVTRVPGP